MTHRWADRAAEYVAAPSGSAAFAVSSTAQWQASVTGLAGNWITFANIPSIATGDTLFYFAYDASGNTEIGLGTYSSSAHTLTRTTILESTNSNAACSFVGNVLVVNTVPAQWFQPTIISAAGTTQGTATPITSRTVFVNGGTGGVILVVPQTTKIINISGAQINVYPNSGAQITDSAGTAYGTNGAAPLGNNFTTTIEPFSATQWYGA